MKHNSIKIKYLGKLTSFALALILLIVLQGCTLNEIHLEDTEWLYLRILNVYDVPQDTFGANHTMTACDVRSDVDCRNMEFVFNHLHLPDIGVEVGSHVRVEVPKVLLLVFPGRFFIFDWELID